MEQKLLIYNTLTRTKERFTPLHAPNVGMYVCGPTVYGDPHLGHARPAITFDILFRYLKHLGYKVRYVRNITDVGHLEHDADEGDDKIEKKARLEQLEPMQPHSDVEPIPKAGLSSDWSLQPDSMKLDSLVIAHQPRRGEYVPGPCTHRPSSHESRGYLKCVTARSALG